MEWFTAISGLVVDLAWPVVALTAIVLFRKPLGEVIGRVRSVDVPGGAITFGDELHEVERQVQDAAEQLTPSPFDQGYGQAPQGRSEPPGWSGSEQQPGFGGSPADRSPYTSPGDGDPVAAVVRSWSAVEEKVVGLHRAVTGDSSRRFYSDAVLTRLTGVLPAELVRAIVSLHRLRDRAVREGSGISGGEAVAYANSADTVIEVLDTVARTTGHAEG